MSFCMHTHDVKCPNCDPSQWTVKPQQPKTIAQPWVCGTVSVSSLNIQPPKPQAELLPDGKVRIGTQVYEWLHDAQRWALVL